MTQLHPKRLAQIAQFELVRLFLTKRGLLFVAAFAICWLLILRYPIAQSVSLISSPEFTDFARQAFGAIGISRLLDWPESELAVYWLIALHSFPPFCLFLCSDQTVGDRQRGTLRFLSLRATRSEIIIGRFLGQLLILAVLLFITLMATVAMLGYREPSLFLSGFSRSFTLLFYLLITVMPFIALMSLLNTVARSSRLALVLAILFFAGGNIVISLLTWQLPLFEVMYYIFPGYQIDLLAGQRAGLTLGVGLPLLQTAVLLVVGERIFARSLL